MYTKLDKKLTIKTSLGTGHSSSLGCFLNIFAYSKIMTVSTQNVRVESKL